MVATPNGSLQPRRTITAGGRTRELTLHAIIRMRQRNITEAQVAYVLDNWQLRGIDNSSEREPSIAHFALLPELDRMLKVAVSIDNAKIATTHFDRVATRNFKGGTRSYFFRKYQNLEERDEGGIR